MLLIANHQLYLISIDNDNKPLTTLSIIISILLGIIVFLIAIG